MNRHLMIPMPVPVPMPIRVPVARVRFRVSGPGVWPVVDGIPIVVDGLEDPVTARRRAAA
jgi:hypothetical protein